MFNGIEQTLTHLTMPCYNTHVTYDSLLAVALCGTVYIDEFHHILLLTLLTSTSRIDKPMFVLFGMHFSWRFQIWS